MRHWGLVISVTLAGCHYPDMETWIVPLAEMNARFTLDDTDRDSYFYAPTKAFLQPRHGRDYCAILSPRDTSIRLDGAIGTMDPGGGGYDGTCDGPAFGWDDYDIDGRVTIELTDGSATWTFIMNDPFERWTAELVSHSETEPIVSGDTVVIDVASGSPLSNLRVTMNDGATKILDLDESNGLVHSGDQLSFVMPAVAKEVTGYLELHADAEILFERCDASLGCQTSYPRDDNFSVTVSP
jgi:hypothetical protein